MADQINESSVPVQTLLTRFKEAESFRKKYEDDWDKNRDLYEGKQWAGIEKVAWFQSEPVFNKIFQFVEIHRAYLSDNKWGLDVVPAGIPKSIREAATTNELNPTQQVVGVDSAQQIFDMTDKIDKLLDFLWLQNRMKSKLSEAIMFAFLYGTSFVKSVFDTNNVGDSGIGQIETKVVSPWYIFPDPNATCVQDASFIFEHHPVTYRWIIEHYPEKAQEVKNRGLGSQTQMNERRGSSPRGALDNAESKAVDIYECYYTDSSISEDTDSPELSYPTGRMTLMTSTGVVLEDHPYEYQEWPYARLVEIPRPAEFFGDCTVSRVAPIQETINTILRAIIDNGLWIVHGIWIADTTSGIDPDVLAGYAPRDVIVKNPGTEVRRDAGEALPQHLFQLLDSQVLAFDEVSGTPEGMKGNLPSRQPVGTSQLQMEAGEVRTRERQRRVEEMLEELGKTWIDIAATSWNDKRVISNKRSLGGFDMFELSKKELAEWRWDIHVVPGSTSPLDSKDQMETLFQLMERGQVMVPPMYLVEAARQPGLQAAMMEELSKQQEDLAAQEQEQMAQQEQAPQPEQPIAPEPPPQGGEPGDIPPDIAAQLLGGGADAGLGGLPPEAMG
jgi:hypothetical protein